MLKKNYDESKAQWKLYTFSIIRNFVNKKQKRLINPWRELYLVSYDAFLYVIVAHKKKHYAYSVLAQRMLS